MKLKLSILLICCIFSVKVVAQGWNNPENQMLNGTMADFFFYTTKDSVAFSDPNGLKAMEHHAKFSDDYHDESERITEMFRQQRMLQQGPMMPRYRVCPAYPYRNYNNGPGFIIP